jgi:tetratricopeptide (TPR) repeat protein
LVEPEFAPEADARGSDLAAAEHAETCEMCSSRLRDQRSVQASLRNMAAPLASARKPDCPPENEWLLLAAGLSSSAEAAPLLEHASDCDYCGQLLKSATQDFSPEISAEEERTIRQLASAGLPWQRDLAQKMAGMSGAVTAPARAQRSQPRLFSANWTRWAVPLGAAAAVAVGAFIYVQQSTPSLASTNQLIAQAFTEQRPFELRFPGAGYGPVRQQRGGSGPSRSRMDEPPELLQAETQIAQGLAKHPDDPGWLQTKAQVDLYEGNYTAAIEELQRAETEHPEDLSLKLDLATGYFERAGRQSSQDAQNADYNLALRALNRVLGANPNDPVALFNRAMVYQRQKRCAEAAADWNEYLKIDPTGTWAEEARRYVGAGCG